MANTHPNSDAEGIGVPRPENTDQQKSPPEAVASLFCALGGIALSLPAWIFTNQTITLAQGYKDRFYKLGLDATVTGPPGQVSGLASSYAQYQQASASSGIFVFLVAVMMLFGLILAMIAAGQVNREQTSDPKNLSVLAMLLNSLALMLPLVLLLYGLQAWLAFLFWGAAWG